MSTADTAQIRLLREQAFAAAHPVLLDQLRGYTGRNAFVLQMVRKLDEWGGLTEGQAIACNRMLASARMHEDSQPDPRGDWPSETEITSEHVGTVKERLRDQRVRVDFCKQIRDPIFPRGPLYMVKMVTERGDHLTWFTEGKHAPFTDFRVCDFTVKEHETYKGTKSTKVSRVVFK